MAAPAAFVAQLRAALPPDALLFGDAAAAAGSHDMSRHAACAPFVVAQPASVDAVAAVVRACAAHRVAITPRGAGSGVEGGAIPVRGGLVLDTSKLNSVRVFPDECLAVVGPGVRKLDLARALAPYGFVFGPDPCVPWNVSQLACVLTQAHCRSSNPSLGGMASTSASGMTTLRYGTTRENVVSMLVVLPSGDVIRTRTAVRKSSTGLELNQLYLGSEGTLGVIAELTLRLFPAPRARAGTLLPFASVAAAAEAVAQLLRAALPTLLRCELLNAVAITCTNKVFKSQFDARPTLFIECAGVSADDVRRDATAAAQLARRMGGGGAEPPAALTEGEALDELWELRRGCYPASLGYRKATGAAPPGAAPDKVLITDVCVPLRQLPAVIAATEADFEAAGLLCVICAHIADGNFHCLVPYSTPAEAAACHAAEDRMIARVIAAGGTVSGEHGVGMGKVEHCLCEHGHAHMRVQASIKRALDPLGIMNPGKLYHFDDPPAAVARL